MSLLSSRKRRNRTSSQDKRRSHHVPNKVIILDRHLSFDGTVDSRSLKVVRAVEEGKFGFKTRLRRGSSKLLSFFRISSHSEYTQPRADGD